MKRFALFATLVLLPALLGANPVIVTWDWSLEDPLVTTFRYQMDEELPEGWTVVDATVTSYSVEADGAIPHTLYLQQSYDAINYSESAMASSRPLTWPLPSPPTSLVIKDDGLNDSIPTTPLPAESQEVVATNRYSILVTLGGTATRMAKELEPYHYLEGQAELGVQFNNILTWNRHFGLGAEAYLSYAPMMPISGPDALGWRNFMSNLLVRFDLAGSFGSLVQGIGLAAGPKIDMEMGKARISLGADIFANALFDGNATWLYGGMGNLTLSYAVSNRFSMGLAGRYGFLFEDGFSPVSSFIQGTLFMGLAF